MLLTLLAGGLSLYLLVGVWWFGRRRHGYSHRRHTISELGEHGATDARVVAGALFAPTGLGLLVLAWLIRSGPNPGRLDEPLGLLAATLGVGYLGAALFPCDPGSPLDGTWRQHLHNLAGGIEYVGGAASLWLAAQAAPHGALRDWLHLGAVAVAVVTVALSVPHLFPVRGLVQRVGEFMLIGTLVLLTFLSR